MSPPSLRRYRAERLLRKEFSGLRSKVLGIVRSQLRAKGIALDPADLEACYAQAWHGLYATVLDGEEVENPSAWLVLVTFRRAIDETRSAGRHTPVGELEATTALDPDMAGELDDRARLRQVFEGLRASLSGRECEAASLCYLQGLSRAEAAERMGISESRMRKLMEGRDAGRPGVAGKVGELLGTIQAGGWCEQQSSLMRAFAFGVLDPGGERHTLAMAHCRECPSCRAHVASLRGLAAVLPLPLLSPSALAGGVAGATSTTARGGASLSSRAATVGPRAGGRATSTGWGGLGGSLATKLAVTALVLLGAGYAVLGSRAHGSPPSARPVIAPRSVLVRAPSLARTSAPSAPVRRRHRARHPASASIHLRASPTRATGPLDEANSEFLPERIGDGVPVVSPAAAPASPRTASSTAGEFGIE